MKAVGNLTDFVRAHMLEPFNAAKATADIVAHFEHLTSAHEAVQRAHAQLAALTPLLKDCDVYDAVAAEIADLTAQREALRYYFADQKATLLEDQLQILHSERTRLTLDRRQLEERLEDLRARETDLNVERAGHGGNRLAEIERQDRRERDGSGPTRIEPAKAFAELLDQAGLAPVTSAEQFVVRRARSWRRVRRRGDQASRTARRSSPTPRWPRGGLTKRRRR